MWFGTYVIYIYYIMFQVGFGSMVIAEKDMNGRNYKMYASVRYNMWTVQSLTIIFSRDFVICGVCVCVGGGEGQSITRILT